ncbi:MAG: NAD(P)/FAD-dependent oxidoreductase [Anaerolineales bacterium]
MIYDVVVIGASSSGLYAAEILAKNGQRVVLFDREESFTPAARTYIITPGLLRVMPEVEPELISHTINTIEVQAGEERAEIQLFSPDLIIDREQLITILKTRAENAGVEIHLGSEFVGLKSITEGTGILIQSRGEERLIKANYLIGADGVSSTVAKAVGLPEHQVVPLLQAEITLPDEWDPGVTKVWFEVKDTPYFYWLIPESGTSGVVGLIAEPGADIRTLLDRFLNKNNFQPLAYQAGQAALHIPGSNLEKRIGDLTTLLVGDTAGQVKVTTVGGTVTGLSGARAAAKTILNGVPNRKARGEVQRELDIHYFIRHLLEKMDQTDYIRLIQSITPAVKSFLNKYDRDAMRRQFWKLPLIQPRFIPLGLKLLLRRK